MSLAPTNRLGPVYTRPKTAAATGTDQRQGTLWVDATYGSDASGTRDESGLPYQTISAALLDSFGGDKIVISPGAYAEALTIPHDLFFDAAGVGGLTSIDISAGRVRGRIGKIEYSETGCVIYPDSNAADNGACLLFASDVGRTQSTTRWSVGMHSGDYNYGNVRINFNTANWNLIDWYGLGQQKAHVITTASTGNSGEWYNFFENSFQNLKFSRDGGTNNYIMVSGTVSGLIRDIEVDGAINISGTGVKIEGLLGRNTLNLSGDMTALNVKADMRLGTGSQIVIVENMTGFVEVTQGSLQLNGTIDGSVSVGDLVSRISPGASLDMTNGAVEGGHAGLRYIAQDNSMVTNYIWRMFNTSLLFETSGNTLLGGVYKNGSLYSNCRSEKFYRQRSIVEAGCLFEQTVFMDAIGHDSAEVKGTFDKCKFTGRGTSQLEFDGFVVSDGAILRDCLFENFGTYILRGRDLLQSTSNARGFGSTTENPTYFEASDTLVFPLGIEPDKGDGAGGRTGMSGDVFNARIIRITDQPTPTAGEELSNLDGGIYEFEVYNDVGGALYGFGDWVLRSTATDAARIDGLLNSPASDLVSSTTTSVGHNIGMEATVKVVGATVNGPAILAPEILLTNESFDQTENSICLTDTGDALRNGRQLLNAFNAAKVATPNGQALAADNTYTIFLEQGVYELPVGVTLDVDVDFIRMVGKDYVKPSAKVNNTNNALSDFVDTGVIVKGENNVSTTDYAILRVNVACSDFVTQGISYQNTRNSNGPRCIQVDSTSASVLIIDTFLFPVPQYSIFIEASEVKIENLVVDGSSRFIDLQGRCRDIYTNCFQSNLISGYISGDCVIPSPSSSTVISGVIENLFTSSGENFSLTGDVRYWKGSTNFRVLWGASTGTVWNFDTNGAESFRSAQTFDVEIKNAENIKVVGATSIGFPIYGDDFILRNSPANALPQRGEVKEGARFYGCQIANTQQNSAVDNRLATGAPQGSYKGRFVDCVFSGSAKMPAIRVGHRAEIIGGLYETLGNANYYPIEAQMCLPDQSAGWTKTATTITLDLNAAHGITNADKVPIRLIDFDTVDPDGIDGTYTEGDGNTLDFDTSRTQVIISSTNGTITAVGNNGGQAVITSNGHGLLDGAQVTITGTTSYNGTHTVVNATLNTFEIGVGFVANEAGSWTAGLAGQTAGNYVPTGLVQLTPHQERVKFLVSARISGATLIGGNPVIDPDITLI